MVVHRLLAASLNLAPLPAKARDRAALHGLADNLNARHRNAQFAGRASVELHTLIFFQKRTVVADARIIRVCGRILNRPIVQHLADDDILGVLLPSKVIGRERKRFALDIHMLPCARHGGSVYGAARGICEHVSG